MGLKYFHIQFSKANGRNFIRIIPILLLVTVFLSGIGLISATATSNTKGSPPVVTGFSGPTSIDMSSPDTVYPFSVSVTGGTKPYTYEWKAGVKTVFKGTQYASVNIPMRQLHSNGAGMYWIWFTVTDANGYVASYKKPDGFYSKEFTYGLTYDFSTSKWKVVKEPSNLGAAQASSGAGTAATSAKQPIADLQLTYPVGNSSKVFTTGWVFGARCIVNGKDLSNQVEWSGTGTFSPAKGALSRPTFRTPGTNQIILKYTNGKKFVKKVYTVTAVSPEGYACVGDLARCEADIHGCPNCPHTVVGPIATGSALVKINGKPAARQGDTGHHAVCCGSNTFVVAEGDPTVLIDGKPAARIGDKTKHCGGIGKIVQRKK